MRTFFVLAYILIGIPLIASNVATQVVTMSISAINELAITGAAPTLTISTATAGSLPTPVSSTGITYGYTTNNSATTTKRITGSIDSSMPTNLQLTANLNAPSGATSTGATILTTTAADLITGIPVPSNQASLSLTYTFSQTAAVSSTSSFSRTVTFTLIDT